MEAVALEITWIVRLLEECGVQKLKPVSSECDDKSALQMAPNPVLHYRTKHIAIDCYFTKEKAREGLILSLDTFPLRSRLSML